MKIFCLDCNKELKGHGKPIRCKSCNQSFLKVNYKHGKYSKNSKNSCIDCNKKISLSSKRCNSCNKLGKRNGFYRTDKFDGINNLFYSKKHSKESKRKQSLSHGGTGVPYENTEYSSEFDNPLKEQIRFRDKYKCKLCGCPQIENGKQLDVHHIDYNKKNNDIYNLISLCKSCHMKTNNNRKYWRFKLCQIQFVASLLVVEVKA